MVTHYKADPGAPQAAMAVVRVLLTPIAWNRIAQATTPAIVLRVRQANACSFALRSATLTAMAGTWLTSTIFFAGWADSPTSRNAPTPT